MRNLKKLSFQTLWQILNKAVASASTIFILALVARNFGKEGTGVYTLVLTYIGMFYLLTDFGFNAHALPFLKKDNYEDSWRKLFGLRILWSVLVAAIALLLLPFLPFAKGEFSLAALLGAGAILGNSLFITSTALFQSKLKLELSSISSSLGIAAMTALIFYLVKSGFSVPSLMLAQTLGWILTGIISLIFVTKFFTSISPEFDFLFIGSFFKETWPISLTLALNLIYFRFDSFVISTIKSFSDVGVYNLAYSVFQSVLVLPAFIMNSVYPLMIDELKLGEESFKKYLKKASLALFFISLGGTILTLILSPLVISLLSGGNDFSSSVTSLRILSLGFPIYFLTALFMWTLVTLKEYKVMALIYTIGLFFNVIANLIYIPQYSFLASSWITVLSEGLILVLQLFVVVPKLRRGKEWS